MQTSADLDRSTPSQPGPNWRALSSRALRDVAAESRLRWPRRLTAGLALLERGTNDEWAMDAYEVLGCDPIAALRRVAVLGLSLDRTVSGLDTILEILAAEAVRPAPETEVALAALRAIDGYSLLVWRDATVDLRTVLGAWVDHADPAVHAKARQMVALLEPWGARRR